MAMMAMLLATKQSASSFCAYVMMKASQRPCADRLDEAADLSLATMIRGYPTRLSHRSLSTVVSGETTEPANEPSNEPTSLAIIAEVIHFAISCKDLGTKV